MPSGCYDSDRSLQRGDLVNYHEIAYAPGNV